MEDLTGRYYKVVDTGEYLRVVNMASNNIACLVVNGNTSSPERYICMKAFSVVEDSEIKVVSPMGTFVVKEIESSEFKQQYRNVSMYFDRMLVE